MLGRVTYNILVLSLDCISNVQITVLLSNGSYQLGDGTLSDKGDAINEMGNNLTAVDLGNDFIPTDIEAGRRHVCAISQSNAVKCWGQFIHSLYFSKSVLFSLHSNLQEATPTDNSALAVNGQLKNLETLYPLWNSLIILFQPFLEWVHIIPALCRPSGRGCVLESIAMDRYTVYIHSSQFHII